MKKYIGLIIAAGAAYYFYKQFQAGKNANFYFKKIKVKDKKLVLDIAAQNPTNQKLQLKSLSGEIFANKKLVGNISTFTPVDILPNSETILNFTIVPNLAGLVNLISNFIKKVVKKTEKLGLVINLTGTANVNNIAIPLNINYKL